MFTGTPTRIFTSLVVFAQVTVSLALASVIPASQPVARADEAPVQLEASDIPLADEPAAGEPLIGQAAAVADEQAAGVLAGEAAEAPGWEPPAPAFTPAFAREGRYSSDQLQTLGVIQGDGCRYTWYSQRVLSGDGLDIEGRHVSDEGYVVDSQERIVVASSDLPIGAELAIPFGSGCAVVADTGCASGILDIYTDF